MTTANEFNDKAAALGVIDAQTYQAYLEKLVAQGQGYGKTENIGGFLLKDIVVQTLTIKGEVETTKNVAVEKLYLTIDLSQYPLEKTRQLVVEDLAKKWGQRVIKENDLPDFSGPGIWTVKKGGFEGDYVASAEGGSVFTPNPEAYRVCLDIAEDIKIPVQWDGGFKIAAGGALAIREKDLPALAEALNAIKKGDMTAEEALLTIDAKGNLLAKFDVYGMEPNFLRGDGQGRKANYGSVELKDSTKAIAASFTVSPAAKKLPDYRPG